MGATDLNGGALFNAEFGIRHRGSTVPERSGVALSFCRRPAFGRFLPVVTRACAGQDECMRLVSRNAIDWSVVVKVGGHITAIS